MVVWTDKALEHITEFIDGAREDTEETAKAYMRRLVDYVDILNTMPELGKDLEFKVLNYDLKQLIHKKHRIIYHLKGDNAVILAVLHTRLDLDKALRKLKKDIK